MDESFEVAPFILQTILATLLSGSIIGLLLKALVDRRFEQTRFTRDWKEQALAKVIGPVIMHLNRTLRVRNRYQESYAEKTTSYFDAKLMRDSNEVVRSILLSNGHLIPEGLRPHAHDLIAHYDVWLRRFDAKVELENPTAESTFDVGFAEVPFPRPAAEAFQQAFDQLRGELYGAGRA